MAIKWQLKQTSSYKPSSRKKSIVILVTFSDLNCTLARLLMRSTTAVVLIAALPELSCGS